MKPLLGSILFPQKEGKSSYRDKSFQVISARSEVSGELSRLLRLAGFTQIDTFDQPLSHLSNTQICPESYGVVVDIGSTADAESVVNLLLSLIPRSIWCCVVGDSDSITLAQVFARYGIHYFNLKSQCESLIQAAVTGASLRVKRWAVSISVLGCKGGVGTTYVAWQLANQMAQQRPAPTLYIQGNAASQDIDLLAGKKLQQEITPVTQLLDVLHSDEAYLPDLSQERFNNYNFILFDQAIHNADKETLRQIAGHSSCMVMVMDRTMTSMRRVRQMIETLEAINRAGMMSRRLLLCLNDSRPIAPEMLSTEDIESLLGREISVVIPWQGGQARSLLRRRRTGTPMENLTQQVLGSPPKSQRLGSFWAKKKKES